MNLRNQIRFFPRWHPRSTLKGGAHLGLSMAAERPAVAEVDRCGWKWAARNLSPRAALKSSAEPAVAGASALEDVPRSSAAELGVLPSSSRSFLCCSRSLCFACSMQPHQE